MGVTADSKVIPWQTETSGGHRIWTFGVKALLERQKRRRWTCVRYTVREECPRLGPCRSGRISRAVSEGRS